VFHLDDWGFSVTLLLARAIVYAIAAVAVSRASAAAGRPLVSLRG